MSRYAVAVCLMLVGGCATTERNNAGGLEKLQRDIQQCSRGAEGRVGAAMCLLETREVVSVAGDERFPMQSVYKLPIAMAVLHEVDAGRLRLDACVEVSREELADGSMYSPMRQKYPDGTKLTIQQLIGYAVSESDNVASDLLLRRAGGPQKVTGYLRGFEVDGVTVANSEREMAGDGSLQYRNWATPRGAIKMLEVYHAGAGLSPKSQEVLDAAMRGTVTGLYRIKGLLPEGTAVAHKTGTSGTIAGRTAATNDIGIVTLPNGQHLAVAVFVCDSVADTEAREAAIARIARAGYDYFYRE